MFASVGNEVVYLKRLSWARLFWMRAETRTVPETFGGRDRKVKEQMLEDINAYYLIWMEPWWIPCGCGRQWTRSFWPMKGLEMPEDLERVPAGAGGNGIYRDCGIF